jgi:lipopolysaccharide transport system ATP-binding protein
MTETSIVLKDVYVNGVDTNARAAGLKHFFLGKGKLSSTKIPILRGVNFEAKHGDKVAVIGRNGSGKSSLLKVISGIYPIASGYQSVQGTVAPLIEMGLGFDSELTGISNIKLSFAYRGQLALYSKKLEKEIIEFSELGDKIFLPLKSYSSGMQARLAFSCTVFQDPDILLLDEVLSVGDQGFVEKSRKLIEDRFKNAPISILVHHSIDQVKSLCNRFILMDNGKIVLEDNCKEIIKYYDSKILNR